MFADSYGAIVIFDDSTFVSFDKSVVNCFHRKVPLWKFGRDTVEQLGGV
jgi:hypothetical protein